MWKPGEWSGTETEQKYNQISSESLQSERRFDGVNKSILMDEEEQETEIIMIQYFEFIITNV